MVAHCGWHTRRGRKLGQLARCENGSGNQQNALASLVHGKDSTLSPFVRLCYFLLRRFADLIRLSWLGMLAPMKCQARLAEGLRTQVASFSMRWAERRAAVVAECAGGTRTGSALLVMHAAHLN